MGSQVGLDEVYIRAAALGDKVAQSTLAVACLNVADGLAENDPGLSAEYLASAELAAVMAHQSGTAHDAAILSAVVAVRSIRCAERDPVRSLNYRQWAECLFDAVEECSDTHAIGIVAWALNRLADCGDEAAADRLNRVMDALPAGEARLLRETVRKEAQEPAIAAQGGEAQ